MSRTALIAATMLTATTGALIGADAPIPKPAPQKIDGLVRWVYDYEQGRQLARKTGRPMFVVFRCER